MEKNDDSYLNDNVLSFNSPFVSNSSKYNNTQINNINNLKKNSFSTNAHSLIVNNNNNKKSDFSTFNKPCNTSKNILKKTKTQTERCPKKLANILNNPNNNKYGINFFLTRAQSLNSKKKKIYEQYLKPRKSIIGNNNPLFIPKEDLIFEEMKNYLCFQEAAKESMDRIGIPCIYIKMRLNKKYDVKNNKLAYSVKTVENDEDDEEKYYKKKGIFRSINLLHSKQNRKKLKKLYNTTPNFHKALNFAKTTKKIIDLNEYQDVLSQIIKPEVSHKLYKSFQNNLFSLKELAESRCEKNFPFIKTIEKDEKLIIKDINKYSKKFYNNFMEAKRKNIFVKNLGPEFELPYIKFESVTDIKIDDKSIEKSKKSKRKKIVKKLKEFNIKLTKKENHNNEYN